MSEPRVLVYDIETSYLEGPAWRPYDTDLLWVNQDWHMLSFSYKWLGDKKTHVLSLPDFPGYSKDPRDDFLLVTALWKLFNEADIVIAHNGNKFDQRKARARMIIHDLDPHPDLHQIDTLKEARRLFAFTSNKLDDLGEYLGVGRKLDTGGKFLWKSCIEGDMKAWKKMCRYNKQDVILLEKVFIKLRPWIKMPAMSSYGDPGACPRCLAKGTLIKRGLTPPTRSGGRRQRYKCSECRGWCQDRKTIKSDLEYII
jgi:hypothetical protein